MKSYITLDVIWNFKMQVIIFSVMRREQEAT